MSLLHDLTDDELRASHRLKWAAVEPDVLPAWVAEMDLAVARPITDAIHRGVDAGALGYPGPGVDVPGALAAFCRRRYGWELDPALVTVTGSVLGALETVLRHVADDAPVILPTPAYTPFLSVPVGAGRPVMTLPTDPFAQGGTEMPLAAVVDAIERGGRTVILCNPHNPLGRLWRREELEALRDVCEPRGVMVVSDEIHAPLSLPGTSYVPYLTVASPDARALALLSSTKPFNCPGMPCAQIAWNRAEDKAALGEDEMVVDWSLTVPQLAAVAAYTECDDWLDELRERVAANYEVLVDALADALPQARVLPLEATYLAWVDVRMYGHDDPAAVALERGRVKVGAGYGPASEGCLRVNLATSPSRVREVARRLAVLAG